MAYHSAADESRQYSKSHKNCNYVREVGAEQQQQEEEYNAKQKTTKTLTTAKGMKITATAEIIVKRMQPQQQ